MKKIQVLVCCHKADPYIRTGEPYLPIQVGKALHPDLNLGFVNDNEGAHASSNKSKKILNMEKLCFIGFFN